MYSFPNMCEALMKKKKVELFNFAMEYRNGTNN